MLVMIHIERCFKSMWRTYREEKKDSIPDKVDRIFVETSRSALKSRRDVPGAKLTRARIRFVSAEMDPMENSGAAESASEAN